MLRELLDLLRNLFEADTAVLPGVTGVETFLEAATRLLPGWHPVAVEDVEFLAPFQALP